MVNKVRESHKTKLTFLEVEYGSVCICIQCERSKIVEWDLCHCSVTQSCLTLCEPMDCSIPGFPVLYHLPELAQTHVHWVGEPSILSSVVPFSFCLLSFPAPGSFPMSLLFTWGLYSKETIHKMKRQLTEWEKIFATDMTDKGLISNYINSLLAKTQTILLKVGRRSEQTFFQRHTDGQEAYEKMLNLINHQRNAN